MRRGKKIIVAFDIPLYVYTIKSKTRKSKTILNLNNYRNWHYTKSNNAKKAFKKELAVLSLINLGTGPFRLEYTYYHGNRRKIDIANPCSVLDKFTCDALTELKCWPDDNIDFIHEVEYIWGGVDPLKMGYCAVKIYKL